MRLLKILKGATLVCAVLAFAVPAVVAQDMDDSQPSAKKHTKQAPLFPNATRAEPGLGVSADMDKPITQLLALVNSNKSNDEAIATGEKLAASHGANHYDRAVIFQAIGYAYLNKGDRATGIDYLQKCLAENALSNNEQYQLMLQVAKSQAAAGQTDASLATLDKLVAETKQDKPEYDGIRGRVDYIKKDYTAAAAAFQKSLDGSATPDPAEQQMLLSSYFELKQPERAEKVGEDILHAHPDDKSAIMNLAAIYQQAGQPDKTLALLDDARKRNLLTTSDDYRKLYALYSNMKGHENDSAAVINDGLTKGILQPNAEVYTVLAQDYYFTNQMPQSIDAYKKADAASTDGEAALNLAKVYNNMGKMADAKAEAEIALRKGVKQPEDARGIIERAGTTKAPAKKK